jgi:beta-glucanase (GH16 family)
MAAALVAACGSDSSFSSPDDNAGVVKPVVPEGTRFELVHADEFEGDKDSPPPEHWVPEVRNFGFNEERDAITARPENVGLDGEGHLVITARREAYMGREYTSARLNTQGNLAPKYGRIEASIKLPKGKGLWPAFWMLGANIEDVQWPECGEIDILEFRGRNVREMRGSLHGPGYSGGENIGYDLDTGVDLTEGFHTYGIVWSETGVAFEFDGKPYYSKLRSDLSSAVDWVFDHNFFLILNLAVGGTYLKSEQPDETTPLPAELSVDYVRIYRIVEP